VNPASAKGPKIKINESELTEGIENGAHNWAPNDLGKKKKATISIVDRRVVAYAQQSVSRIYKK